MEDCANEIIFLVISKVYLGNTYNLSVPNVVPYLLPFMMLMIMI